LETKCPWVPEGNDYIGYVRKGWLSPKKKKGMIIVKMNEGDL
jgi:hypothetical protein